MEQIKLSDDVIKQIKDFTPYKLTEEQESLIDKLILNKELKKCYKNYGLCKECNWIKISGHWCNYCHFQLNFKNWTSGNNDVDELIQKSQLKAKYGDTLLEWIEYDKFEDIEYLAKGGFGTTFKAVWNEGYILGWGYSNNRWVRNNETKVALKCLHNSQSITIEFLKEVESNNLACDSDGNSYVVRCFGITKDPKTNNFMMVMDLKDGSLRQYLNDNFNSIDWAKKIEILWQISIGLSNIHNSGLIHQDFHCGNILSNFSYGWSFITDLGLCRPANVKPFQSDNKKIYGVLPYVAPEVLKGKEYTQASDIYGFGIIAYEICTGLPPYHDVSHDEFLTIKICYGLRPKSNYKIPQLIINIINQCWDADPSNRPKAVDLRNLLWNLILEERNTNSVICEQSKEADEINKKSFSIVQSTSSTSTLSYMTHPQAVYISRLLDFRNLPEPKNADNNNKLLGMEYSESLEIDFTKLDTKDESN